jgi:hypothetical protein
MKVPDNLQIYFLGKTLSITKHCARKFFTDLYREQYVIADWCPLDVPHSSVLSPCDSKTPDWQLNWDVPAKDNEFFPLVFKKKCFCRVHWCVQ